MSAIADSTVKVGILHSLAGPWAIGEIALKDAELMAIAEINQSGGVLGKQIEPIIADGASEPIIFEQQARKLIEQDQVATIFGCWTSTVRKFIVPTLERLNALLWYPVQYEGLECSKSIFYTAVCPNQQIEPAVQWLLQNKGSRFYLVGSDIVFSRTASKIIRARLKQHGGSVLGEDYVPVGGMDFSQIVANIKQTQPDVVFSTVNSNSNLGFYPQYQAAGIDPEDIPIMAVSVTEEEIQQLGVESAVGHYAAHSYFQSLKNPRNQTFVQNFKAAYGAERVTCDSVESAYVQVYLWKQAVEQAQSFEVDHVRLAAYGQAMQTPGGLVRVEQNHHLWKPCRIGKVQPDGQFDLVHIDDKLVKPQPWLGMDDVQFDASALVTDMLAEAAQAILYNCQLEQKSRELIEANDRLQKLTQRAELLKRSLSSQIRNSLDLDTILITAVTEIRNLLQVDRCKFLWHRDNPSDPFELSHEACDLDLLPDLKRYPVKEIESLGQVILRSGLLQIDDTLTAPQLSPDCRNWLSAFGFKSLLTIVIQTRSGRLGVIVCEQIKQIHHWREYEVELLRDVADQLAIAIDQAELYSQTRTAALQAQIQAQQLQQALYDLQATQAQLVQTEKMSSLGQLVAGIAHEINNPVSFIYGNIDHASDYTQDLLNLIQLYRHHYPHPAAEIQSKAEAIELDFLVTDLPKILTSMRVGAERIRQIVLSLRSFSRLDEAAMKPVDIHEGIDNTLLILQNRLRNDAKSAGIQIIKRYGDLPLVECYAGQMNQVFMNLLVNAIDALEMVGQYPEALYHRAAVGGHALPTIEIRTQRCEPDWVSICIADNGPGIPETFQQRLFDPFFTTKPIGKGTGLGLAISHQIVIEKHKGRLYCSSKPGQGTEFFIEIPVGQLHDNASLAEVSAAP